jgi:hypothetical protein
MTGNDRDYERALVREIQAIIDNRRVQPAAATPIIIETVELHGAPPDTAVSLYLRDSRTGDHLCETHRIWDESLKGSAGTQLPPSQAAVLIHMWAVEK